MAGGVGPAMLNVAVTAVAALTVTAQVPVPEHAPLQPAKMEPASAAALSVTAVPAASDCEQVAPQAMPAGVLVTVPDPVPFFVTASVAVSRAGTANPLHAVSGLDCPAPLTDVTQTNAVVVAPLA